MIPLNFKQLGDLIPGQMFGPLCQVKLKCIGQMTFAFCPGQMLYNYSARRTVYPPWFITKKYLNAPYGYKGEQTRSQPVISRPHCLAFAAYPFSVLTWSNIDDNGVLTRYFTKFSLLVNKTVEFLTMIQYCYNEHPFLLLKDYFGQKNLLKRNVMLNLFLCQFHIKEQK